MATEDYCSALVHERDRERYLATLYAPAKARAALFALHALDLELAEVVRTTTEPMLGQIRLAWWREQLQALDSSAPSAQPVLSALSEHVLTRGVSGASLEVLEDAYLTLLEGGDIEAYSTARGQFFRAGLRILVPTAAAELFEAADRLGTGWAAVEAIRLGHFPADATAVSLAERSLAPRSTPSAARPLFALAGLARRDLVSLRNGTAPEPRGTPARQMRLLWSIVTGR